MADQGSVGIINLYRQDTISERGSPTAVYAASGELVCDFVGHVAIFMIMADENSYRRLRLETFEVLLPKHHSLPR